MSRAYLPPLLRGLGTTIVLCTTLVGVCVAKQDVRANQIKRATLYAKAKANADLPAAADLEFGAENESVAEEMIDNPWFDWMAGFGTAVIASSFFAESYLRWRENS